MDCCSGVVTQAYGQPGNPVLSRGKDSLAILTAAPFRGLPQPEARGRIKFNDRLSMNHQPRRALSRYALTFQGYILSVSCQCRILSVSGARPHVTACWSPFLTASQWRIKCQTSQYIRLLKNRLNAWLINSGNQGY